MQYSVHKSRLTIVPQGAISVLFFCGSHTIDNIGAFKFLLSPTNRLYVYNCKSYHPVYTIRTIL